MREIFRKGIAQGFQHSLLQEIRVNEKESHFR